MNARPHETFFPVPAGTRAAECRSCRAVIYWITMPSGKRMPIDCDVDGGAPPTRKAFADPSDAPGELTIRDGLGVSHFATCPDHRTWRLP